MLSIKAKQNTLVRKQDIQQGKGPVLNAVIKHLGPLALRLGEKALGPIVEALGSKLSKKISGKGKFASGAGFQIPGAGFKISGQGKKKVRKSCECTSGAGFKLAGDNSNVKPFRKKREPASKNA